MSRRISDLGFRTSKPPSKPYGKSLDILAWKLSKKRWVLSPWTHLGAIKVRSEFGGRSLGPFEVFRFHLASRRHDGSILFK